MAASLYGLLSTLWHWLLFFYFLLDTRYELVESRYAVFYRLYYMPIQSNASYLPTMDEFLAHWTQVNAVLGAAPLVVAKPLGVATTRAQFDTLRTTLMTNQTSVQGFINDQEIARGDINIKKAALLVTFNQFIEVVEAYYQGTKFYNAKPLAPGIGEGQDNFVSPMLDAQTLWDKMNTGTAPQGVTLPISVGSVVLQASFASAVVLLQASYKDEKIAAQNVKLARADRNLTQATAYDLMKAYRLAVPVRCSQFPNLIATMPKLTPEPGHTPAAVQASATYVAPSTSHVVHGASADADLDHYEMEGTNGEAWNEEDAVYLGRHEPNEANEFTVAFGLTQPGTAVALKVFVVTTTGNRAGSAPVVVRRPA